ncbi:MAG: PIN domain-containing protein [Armatimonadetes bacterium]|nr:PIN domain-containing protein [Armatimonadota bacterium]
MSVLLDTPVWSEFLQRRSPVEAVQNEADALIQAGSARIIGPIRQEVLSGIQSLERFEVVRSQIQFFPDEELTAEDFEMAAMHFNQCRSRGIQGSNTDFLICSVAIARDLSIFTLDKDFERYAEVLPIKLYKY